MIEPKLRFPEFIDEWDKRKISELGEVITGNTPSTSNKEYYDGAYQFVSPADINENRFIRSTSTTLTKSGFEKCRLVDNGATLFVCIGSTIGKVGQATSKCATNQQINSIVSNENNNKDFIYSLLEIKAARIAILAGNQAVPIVNKSTFQSYTFFVPEKPEQQKIASFLSAVDKKIEQLTRKKELLEEYKKGVMQKLFPKPGEQHPELRFKDDNGEDFPDWEVRELYSLFDDVYDFRGRTPKKLGMEWGGNILSLSANNVKQGFIDFESEANMGNEELYDKWMGEVAIGKNDIVFTMEAPLGQALLIPDDRKYILSQRVIAFKTKEKVVNKFLIQLIWNQNFQNSIERLATGSTAKGINQRSLKKVKVSFPVYNEQERISELLSNIDSKIDSYIVSINKTKTFKKGLLQQMFV